MLTLFRICLAGIFGITVAAFYTSSGDPTTGLDPGEVLARQYCSSCHDFPDPNILTKRSWNYLLTDMGFRLGIVDYEPIAAIPPVAQFHMTTREQILSEAQAIPGEPVITMTEWKAIRKYYEKSSPNRPKTQEKKPQVKAELKQFRLVVPEYQPKGSVLTLARIDPEKGGIILSNQSDQSLTVLDNNLKTREKYQVNEILVDAAYSEESLYFLSIGDLMGRYIGKGMGILHIKDPAKINFYQHNYVIEGLHRPVDIEFADLNGNGNKELIVCNFGDVTGNVSLFESNGDLLAELISAPGAIRSQVHDFNRDGKEDIAVLMGDARENISIFFNKGSNNFERKIVVECHAAYGHTYFELQDFNGDGHMDFLAANGDTDADPFNTLKNYHGVRIYLNDGENNFNLSYFYPMFGAHFAKAADFDGDGDLDIAGSAFFPDFSSQQPEQFVYLENTGNLNFKPWTHHETYQGRWMTLDVGDYDLDGDQDIVLGGGYLPLGMVVDFMEKYKSLAANGKAVLVFENKLVD